MLNDTARADVRRFCGYPPAGQDIGGFQNWRFYQANGLLEYRLNQLTKPETAVASRYLDTLRRAETKDDAALFSDWRRRLCGFLGVPPGPEMEKEAAP